MKYRLLFLSSAIFFIQPVLATEVHQPTTCPSVEAIKAVGVNKAVDSGMLGWTAINQKNTYNTNDEWSFLLYGIKAENESEAVAKGNGSIGALTLSVGPTTRDNNEWTCIYTFQNEDSAYIGLAVTPSMKAEDDTNHFMR